MGQTAQDETSGSLLAHREHGDETRARIIETALGLIADHGFAATSTREIAERLGFTKAALYYHFRTKDDLLSAVVAPAMEGLAALADGAPASSPAERRRVLTEYVELVAAHADLVRVLADDPAARRCTALAAALPLYERFTRVLSGTERPDVAQRTRVRAALGAIHAALVRADPGDDPRTVRDTALVVACRALDLPADRRRAHGRSRR